MPINHDGFALSSPSSSLLISDINSHNHEKNWTNLYDPDVKKTKSITGNPPVDYSMHSPTHEYKTSAFTSVTSSVLSRSNYNYSVIQPSSYQNDCGNSMSSCHLRLIPKCLDYNLKSSSANDDERPLKRKYSRSNSNTTGKYSGKYFRTKIGDNNELNYNNKLNDTDQSTTGNESNNYNTDTTSKLLTETYLLTKHSSHKTMNTSVRKDTKVDKSLTHKESNILNKMKTPESVSSYSKSNTQVKEEDEAVINTSRCNTNDKEKSTTVSGAAYKYLTWREKDRRRRFREEWKHLWLVIPHGLYEVMCLVCHKVMTQRKVDTIKRHTVRRHAELIGLSELEREHLFNELMKQYSMLEANNCNPSSDIHTKRSRKSNEIHYSTRDVCSISNTEQFERLPNTSCCLDSQSSRMNTVKSSSVSSDSAVNEISASRSTSHRKSKNYFNKPFQKVSPTSKHTTNLSTYGREDLLKIPHDSSTVDNVEVLQPNISANAYNTPNFIVNPPTFDKSPGASNSCYASYHSVFENKSYNTTFPSKIGSCVPSFPSSILSPLSPISMDPSSTMNSSFSPGFSSIMSPHADNEKQCFDLKSAINFQSFASTLLSPSSSSLFLPELLSTFSNINKLCTSSSLNKDKHTCMSDKSAIYGYPDGNMNYSPIKTHENIQFKNITAKQIISNNDHNVNCGKTKESLLTPGTLIPNQTLDNKNHNVSMQQPFSSNEDRGFQHTSSLSSASTSKHLQNSFNFLTPPPPPPSFLMNTLTKALINNVPISNQEIADILCKGFCKTIFNTSSNVEKSCESDEPLSHEVYRNYSTSSNPCIQGNISRLQEKESGIRPSSCIDPKRLHRPTVTTTTTTSTSVCPKDPVCQAKSSKNLNKFTISSLLDTECSPVTRKVTKTKTGNSQATQSNPKKHKTSPISDCNHPPLPRQNGLQENFTFKQTSKYQSCVLCNLEGKNPGVCEADTIFSVDNLCRTSANIFHPQDLYNLRNEKQQVFNNCLELPSSSVSVGTLEHNRSLYATCHLNKDICNSIYNHKDQVKFDALSNLNSFKNQEFSTFEACMKFYYLELLRHHYDNVAKANHSTQFGSMSECAPIVEKNGSTGFTDPSEDYNKLSNKD